MSTREEESFGGRVEHMKDGSIRVEPHEYDYKSRYPSALVEEGRAVSPRDGTASYMQRRHERELALAKVLLDGLRSGDAAPSERLRAIFSAAERYESNALRALRVLVEAGLGGPDLSRLGGPESWCRLANEVSGSDSGLPFEIDHGTKLDEDVRAEIELLRAQKGDLERALAKLAEVEKDRDYWKKSYSVVQSDCERIGREIERRFSELHVSLGLSPSEGLADVLIRCLDCLDEQHRRALVQARGPRRSTVCRHGYQSCTVCSYDEQYHAAPISESHVTYADVAKKVVDSLVDAGLGALVQKGKVGS